MDPRRRLLRDIKKLGSEDNEVAARAEERIGPAAADVVPELIAASADANPRVRFRAAALLGASRHPSAFTVLCEMMLDADEEVAYDAAIALGDLGDLRAIPVLAQRMVQRDLGSALISAAAMGMRNLGAFYPSEVAHYVSRLNPSVRVEVIQLLI